MLSCTTSIGKKLENKNSVYSYRGSVSEIINTNCNSCHTHPGSGGIDLDTYSSLVSFTKNGDVLRVVKQFDSNEINMPPPPYKRLSQNEINILETWANNNYTF